MLSLDIMESTLTVFFDFHGGQAFLLIYNLILHAIFLFNFEVIKLLLLLVLLLDNLWLFCFFTSWLKDSFLDLSLFILSLSVQSIIVWSYKPLILILDLIVINFLKITNKSISITDRKKAIKFPLHRLITYLLDTIFVTFLKSENLISAFLCIIDLLPSLLLFLFEESDTISK